MVKAKQSKPQKVTSQENKSSKLGKDNSIGSTGLVGVQKKKKKGVMAMKQSLVTSTTTSNEPKPSKSQMRRLRKKMLKKSIEEKDSNKKPKVKQGEANQKRKNSEHEVKLQNKKQKKTGPSKILDAAQKSGPLKVFMMNIPKSVNSEEVKAFLNKSGVQGIESLRVINGSKKSYGIANFKTASDLNAALMLSKKLTIEGNSISIILFNEKKIEDVDKQNAEVEEDDDAEPAKESDNYDEDEDSDENESDVGNGPENKKKGKAVEVKKDVVVKNLDQGVTSEQLKMAFEKKGLIVTSSKVTDKGPYTSGLVTFINEADFKKAIGFDKKITLNGKAIRVIPAGKSVSPSVPKNNIKSPAKNRNKVKEVANESGDDSEKGPTNINSKPSKASPKLSAQVQQKGGQAKEPKLITQKNQNNVRDNQPQGSKSTMRKKVKNSNSQSN